MSFDASRTVLFFGAGASEPFGIPTMKQFVTDFERILNDSGTEDEREMYDNIKGNLEEQLHRQIDLEAVFTVIDGIINYSPKRLSLLSLYSATGFRNPKNIDVKICKSLRKKFQSFVREKCIIPSEFFRRISSVYKDLFNKLWDSSESKPGNVFKSNASCRYCTTWPIFTTNYDTCLEHYWRQIAKVSLNTGSRVREATRTWVLDPSKFIQREGLKLFKLHGSISWLIEPDGTVTEEQTIMGRDLLGRQFVGELMLYPIQQKELYLEPYISMLKELNYELKTNQNWIVVGYSFNDPVIREIFIKNSDENKKIVLLHPEAQKLIDQKLSDIAFGKIASLNEKFGKKDFQSVNSTIVDQL